MTTARVSYVLLTQCLQNDLFMNRDCRLFLPDHVARSMLLSKRDYDFDQGSGSRRTIPRKVLERGPLGLLLDRVQRRAAEPGDELLHLVNIRDWHDHDDAYDAERRVYGPHCEAGTWGAGYVDGLEHYLDPDGSGDTIGAAPYAKGSLRVHHIHSDSLFDFRPRAEQIGGGTGRFDSSELERLLDGIVEGAERVYVAVIGVYTDLKVTTLLAGLRTRYELSNLAVSDTLTGSVTMERHLAGLDFAKKVLSAEVIHGVNDLDRFLGGGGDVKDEAEVISADSYSRYQGFFQDQQNVLAYQHERLQDYLLLTERRAVKVYNTISRANRFLVAWGGAFLVATLVLSILAAFGKVDWQVAAVTGGLSLAQFVGVFFRASGSDLQRNLTNLAVFKMILESHSLKTAFTRFHLTTPQTLRDLQTPEEAAAAERQIETLRKELDVIDSFDRADYDGLERLGFRADRPGAPEAVDTATLPTDAPPGSNGSG